jgi:ribosome-binding factor A
MAVDRMIRVNELMKREIGTTLFHLIHEPGFDLSAVTVTKVETDRSLQSARVWVSIRDHEARRPAMLETIRKHRHQIQALINRDLKLRFTPKLTFELDPSIEKGDNVLTILSQLESRPAPSAPAAPATNATPVPPAAPPANDKEAPP